MRQSLTESLVLAIAGGLAGLASAAFAQRALLAMVFRGSDYVPIAAEPDRAMLAFSLRFSVLIRLAHRPAGPWRVNSAIQRRRRSSGPSSRRIEAG